MKKISVTLLCLFFWLSSITVLAQYKITEHMLINNGLSNNCIHSMAQDEYGRMWIATESGLDSFDGYTYYNYNTSNSGLNANMINTLYYDVSDHILWIGTYGKGLCCMDIRLGEIKHVDIPGITIANVLDITKAADGGIWIIGQHHIIHYHPGKKKFSLLYTSKTSENLRYAADDGKGKLFVGSTRYGVIQVDVKSKKVNRLSSGLPQNIIVNDLSIDTNGTLWLASREGLWKKTIYSKSFQVCQPEIFKNTEVFEVYPLSRKELWVTFSSGIKIINLQGGKSPSIISSGRYSISQQNIRHILKDRYGNIWLGSNGNGLYFISHLNPIFHVIYPDRTWSIVKDGESCWIGGAGKLLHFRNHKMICTYPISLPGISGGYVISLDNEDKNHLVLAAFSRLLRFNKLNGRVCELHTDEGKSVNAISFYHDKKSSVIWISAVDGIYSIRKGQVRKEKQLSRLLSNQMTNGIRVDEQKKLWVATYNNGIYIFDRYHHLRKHLNQQDGFFTNSVQHLYMDCRHRIWMSTPDGIGFIGDTRYPDRIQVFGYRQGLEDSFIRAIHEDSHGNIWVCANNSISMLNMKTKLFDNYNKKNGIPVTNFSGGMVIMADGTLLVTSQEGVCAFNVNELTGKRSVPHLNIFECVGLFSNEDGNDRTLLHPDKNGIYQLEHNRNSFRLTYSVDDYSLSRQIEYAYIVEGEDKKWTVVDNNFITFRNLAPGKYTVKVRARLHGQEWSNSIMAMVQIHILYPIYWRWYTRLFYLIAIFALVYFIFLHYKRRLQLKNELEMDHHRIIAEQERNDERMQFFTNITHELRTPLTLILAPVEDLLNSKSLHNEDLAKVQLINNNSRRLANLINEILEFRKIETNCHELTVKKGNICELISKVYNLFKESNKNKNVKYVIRIVSPVPDIYFDEDVVSTILNNLLSNASKYTPEGEIVLAVNQQREEGEDYTCITVSDTGYGIPKEALDHIFERYYQVNGKHQASGTGIGLALVKSLAVLHKIRLSVSSKIDKGTTFRLMLRNAESYPDSIHRESLPMKDLRAPVRPKVQIKKDSRPIILVVEDNTEISNYIADSLSDKYFVILANNGAEGTEAAFENIPDLIISDVMMPVEDGKEMTKTLKSDVRTSHIPIILLTAKTSTEDQTEGYNLGADSYLTKPFSMKMLKARIQNIMEQRQMLAHNLLKGENLMFRNVKDVTQNPKIKGNLNGELFKLNIIDRKFMDELGRIIQENIENEDLNISLLTKKMKVSQSTLYRKLKALTGLTGNEIIRKSRINHSIQLMVNCQMNISEAAYHSGFNDLSYFRSCFKEETGQLPSQYLKSL